MIKICLFILCCTLSSVASTDISKDINRIIDRLDPKTNIGIEIVDLTTDTLLYKRNANQLFLPASNMKLFSNAAALIALGSNFQFKNIFSTNARRIVNGVLEGNLFLHLPGDPSFSSERLKYLVQQLKTWNIHTISGNVIIDSDLASIDPYPPGWQKEDANYSYGAPIGPLIIDANRLTFFVNPTYQSGSFAQIKLKDISNSFRISNQIITTNSSKTCGVGFTLDQQNHLILNGCIKAGSETMLQKIAIKNPLLYAEGLIRSLLAEEKIDFRGNIVLEKKAPQGFVLAEDYSKPLHQLLADTLKPSDNLYADALFLQTAKILFGKNVVNWKDAGSSIQAFLEEQMALNLTKARLTDGSGLSRKNLLSPLQTVSLLRSIYYHFPFAYEFISALPIAGRDGTLQKKFKKSFQKDLIRAKTGTMKGVLSLSGYLATKNLHILAFTIFINKYSGVKPSISSRYRNLIEDICNYLLKQPLYHVKKTIKESINPKKLHFLLVENKEKEFNIRQIEHVTKKILKQKSINILFYDNRLVLNDYSNTQEPVKKALDILRTSYSFSVAVYSDDDPHFHLPYPFIWIKEKQKLPLKRVWILKANA